MNASIINLENRLRSYLDSGEELIWAGQPKQGITFGWADIFLVPFSMLWSGMVFFMLFTVIRSNTPLMVYFFLIPFILVGIYILIGRFIFDAESRKRTIYGITNERIIIISGVFRTSIQSFSISTLSNISITEKSDRSGTILLGNEMWFMGMLRGSGWPMANTRMAPAIEMIPNAMAVYKQIVALKKEGKA
jgi:hypothetical protein